MPFAPRARRNSRQTDVTHPESERIDVRVSGSVRQLTQEEARVALKT